VIVSLIQKTILLKGAVGEVNVHALFDSGASYSCVSRTVAESVAHLEPLAEPMEFETAEVGNILEAHYRVSVDFYFEDTSRRFTDELIVIDTLSEDLIIGAKTMQAWKINLNFDTEEVLYDKKTHKLRI
jgi:hypothetical protein